jgi:hypothetical protein
MELRYAWSEGLTSTVVLVEEGTLTTTVNEVPVSEDAVGATTTITRTVTEVGEDGSARIEFSVAGDEPGGLGLPAADMFSEEAIDDLQTELADLSSYSGWMEVDARGVLLDFGVDGLDQDLAELLISTRGLGAELPVLPEEAVGVGATWESYADVYDPRLTLERENDIELVAIDGTRLTLAQSFSVDAEPNLGLDRVFTTAGAVYASRQTEGTGQTLLQLDGLSQTGSADVRFTQIAGLAVTSTGVELQMDLQLHLEATAE